MADATTSDPLAQLRRLLIDGTPLHRHLGLEILVRDGEVVTRLPDRPETKNHLGTQGAPALFAVGDCACATAVIAALGPERAGTARAVVGEARSRFRRPAPGAVLATASIADVPAVVAAFDRDGRVAFDVSAELRTEAGDEVGTMTLTWHLTSGDARG